MFYATDFPAEVISAEGILIASGATVKFSAPTSGDFEGILMYVDRNLDPNDHYVNIEFMSGVTAELNGAIYTLNGSVVFHSATSGTNTAARSIAIVADKVEFTSLGSSDDDGPVMKIEEDFSAFATGSPIKRVTLLE